jgi:hypothetical protein
MKAQAAALGHKSDAGGVMLNLADDASVREAWTRMFANVAAYDASIALDGVLIEAMGKRGMEMIVGAKNDPEWGPVVLAGFGGVTAEILQDVRLLTADLTQEAVEAELMQLKSAALLAGYRGSPALDVPALAALIVKVGRCCAPSLRSGNRSQSGDPASQGGRRGGAGCLDAGGLSRLWVGEEHSLPRHPPVCGKGR